MVKYILTCKTSGCKNKGKDCVTIELAFVVSEDAQQLKGYNCGECGKEYKVKEEIL